MTDALEDHEGTVSSGGITITNLLFADDIDSLAGGEEVAKIVECLHKSSLAIDVIRKAEIGDCSASTADSAFVIFKSICYDPFQKYFEEGG